MNSRVDVLLGLLLVLAAIPVVPVVGQTAGGDPVSWLSTGDSYSSGEGVFGNRGDCARSNDAWGRVAVSELRESGWFIPQVGFTACTGHMVEDFFNPEGSGLYYWGKDLGVSERVDVLTLSFGGNDIGFADIIRSCLVVPSTWGGAGCQISELTLQERMDALLRPPKVGCSGGRHGVNPDFLCDLWIGPGGERGTYVDFLVKLARDHLTPRGRLVVAGYPQLFAPTGEWPVWAFAACAGVTRGDTEKLGRVASYFDATLKVAVSQANQQLGADRVVYVSTRDLYRDGSHELCGSGEDWLNGVSNNRGIPGELRWETSFHPNKAGHLNTGENVARVLRDLGMSGTQEDSRIVVLTGSGLEVGAIGSSYEQVSVGLTDLLGAPDEDTGWHEGSTSRFGVCPGDVRGLRWGDLWAVFIEDGSRSTHRLPPGRIFWSFYAQAGVDGDDATFGPPAIETEAGIAIGDSAYEAVAAHGPLEPQYDALLDSVLWRFEVGEHVSGYVNDSPEGPVAWFYGGFWCGE